MVFYYYNLSYVAVLLVISIIVCIIRARRNARFQASLKPQTTVITVDQAVPMQPYPPNQQYYQQPGYGVPPVPPAAYPSPMGDPMMQQFQYQQQQQQQQYPPQLSPQPQYQYPQSQHPAQSPYLAPAQSPYQPVQQAQHTYPTLQPAPPVPAGMLSPPPVYSPSPDVKAMELGSNQNPETTHHVTQASGESSNGALENSTVPGQRRNPQAPQQF